jgi:hypothetical protein
MDDIYSDADIEMITAHQDADELAAYQREQGKSIDPEAETGLKWVVDNTYGGSLTMALTQWLYENGYATDRPSLRTCCD